MPEEHSNDRERREREALRAEHLRIIRERHELRTTHHLSTQELAQLLTHISGVFADLAHGQVKSVARKGIRVTGKRLTDLHLDALQNAKNKKP